MSDSPMVLKGEERIVQALRALYSSYGYAKYKMRRFEEYDLYARNKDFLVSGNIITFTDTDGSLMALKPDVTLSIVKGFREESQCISRVTYDEKVYRVSSSSSSFREITQVGLECLGDIGFVQLGEVALLAQKSLILISERSMLTISHMDITEAFLEDISSLKARAEALSYLEKRNISAMDKLSSLYPESSEAIMKLKALLLLDGSNEETISALRAMGAKEKAVKELEEIVSILDNEKVRIDFTVLEGMNYYNGITFRGYIDGVPGSVVSGGQYDRLMARMGKKAKAIGFAVYLDALEKLLEETEEYDVDVALVYSDACSMSEVLKTAEEIRAKGRSVATMKKVPQKLKSRETVFLKGGENA